MSPSVGWQGEPRNLAYRPRARLDEQGAARVSVRHPEAMGCVATHPPGALCVHEIAQPRILEREQRRRTPEFTQLEDAQFAVETPEVSGLPVETRSDTRVVRARHLVSQSADGNPATIRQVAHLDKIPVNPDLSQRCTARLERRIEIQPKIGIGFAGAGDPLKRGGVLLRARLAVRAP